MKKQLLERAARVFEGGHGKWAAALGRARRPRARSRRPAAGQSSLSALTASAGQSGLMQADAGPAATAASARRAVSIGSDPAASQRGV